MKQSHTFKYIARIIALVWAGWWVFFGLASGIGEGLDPIGVVIHTAVPGLIFLVLAIIAWLRQDIGGALLVLAGLVIMVIYPLMARGSLSISTILVTMSMLALPPLIAGGLCLACWRQSLYTT
ncbi:MAG: hypothetical protein IPH82_09720 [Chloroflexi bacterium]|nr:hypothetical protein [Chloroflexota bacterium]